MKISFNEEIIKYRQISRFSMNIKKLNCLTKQFLSKIGQLTHCFDCTDYQDETPLQGSHFWNRTADSFFPLYHPNFVKIIKIEPMMLQSEQCISLGHLQRLQQTAQFFKLFMTKLSTKVKYAIIRDFPNSFDCK